MSGLRIDCLSTAPALDPAIPFLQYLPILRTLSRHVHLLQQQSHGLFLASNPQLNLQPTSNTTPAQPLNVPQEAEDLLQTSMALALRFCKVTLVLLPELPSFQRRVHGAILRVFARQATCFLEQIQRYRDGGAVGFWQRYRPPAPLPNDSRQQGDDPGNRQQVDVGDLTPGRATATVSNGPVVFSHENARPERPRRVHTVPNFSARRHNQRRSRSSARSPCSSAQATPRPRSESRDALFRHQAPGNSSDKSLLSRPILSAIVQVSVLSGRSSATRSEGTSQAATAARTISPVRPSLNPPPDLTASDLCQPERKAEHAQSASPDRLSSSPANLPAREPPVSIRARPIVAAPDLTVHHPSTCVREATHGRTMRARPASPDNRTLSVAQTTARLRCEDTPATQSTKFNAAYPEPADTQVDALERSQLISELEHTVLNLPLPGQRHSSSSSISSPTSMSRTSIDFQQELSRRLHLAGASFSASSLSPEIVVTAATSSASTRSTPSASSSSSESETVSMLAIPSRSSTRSTHRRILPSSPDTESFRTISQRSSMVQSLIQRYSDPDSCEETQSPLNHQSSRFQAPYQDLSSVHNPKSTATKRAPISVRPITPTSGLMTRKAGFRPGARNPLSIQSSTSASSEAQPPSLMLLSSFTSFSATLSISTASGGAPAATSEVKASGINDVRTLVNAAGETLPEPTAGWTPTASGIENSSVTAARARAGSIGQSRSLADYEQTMIMETEEFVRKVDTGANHILNRIFSHVPRQQPTTQHVNKDSNHQGYSRYSSRNGSSPVPQLASLSSIQVSSPTPRLQSPCESVSEMRSTAEATDARFTKKYVECDEDKAVNQGRPTRDYTKGNRASDSRLRSSTDSRTVGGSVSRVQSIVDQLNEGSAAGSQGKQPAGVDAPSVRAAQRQALKASPAATSGITSLTLSRDHSRIGSTRRNFTGERSSSQLPISCTQATQSLRSSPTDFTASTSNRYRTTVEDASSRLSQYSGQGSNNDNDNNDDEDDDSSSFIELIRVPTQSSIRSSRFSPSPSSSLSSSTSRSGAAAQSSHDLCPIASGHNAQSPSDSDSGDDNEPLQYLDVGDSHEPKAWLQRSTVATDAQLSLLHRDSIRPSSSQSPAPTMGDRSRSYNSPRNDNINSSSSSSVHSGGTRSLRIHSQIPAQASAQARGVEAAVAERPRTVRHDTVSAYTTPFSPECQRSETDRTHSNTGSRRRMASPVPSFASTRSTSSLLAPLSYPYTAPTATIPSTGSSDILPAFTTSTGGTSRRMFSREAVVLGTPETPISSTSATPINVREAAALMHERSLLRRHRP